VTLICTRASLFRALGFLLISTFLVGCGTTADVLVPGINYTSRASDYRGAIVQAQQPQLESGIKETLNRTDSQDGVLYALEAARMQSLAGRIEDSIRTYQLATDVFDRERASPTVSIGRTFFSAAALGTNDLAIPYRSESYERLMAYNYLALNFLVAGAFDHAQIALNAAEAEQYFLRDREGELLAAAQNQAQQNRIGWSAQQEVLSSPRQQLQVDRTVLEPHQSALSYYLAGLLFEARGDADRAAIMLQQGAGLLPRNPYLDQTLAQLPRRSESQSARVVIISNDGLISTRSTVAVPFPWNRTILQVALPVYENAPPPIRPLTIRSGGTVLGRTAVIANLDGQARKTLSDHYPAILTRQVLRLIAKYQTQDQLARENPWAGLAAQLFNLLTDKADLRGWLTLPAYIQTAHFDLEPGFHDLTIEGIPALPLDLPPQSLTFIMLTRAGQQYYQNLITFDARGNPVDPFLGNSNANP